MIMTRGKKQLDTGSLMSSYKTGMFLYPAITENHSSSALPAA